jgi:hypothetical protein
VAEAVDSIVAELIVKGVDQYEANFNRASSAHLKFGKTLDALAATTFDLQAEGRKYKAGADMISQAEEQTAQKVTRSRKARTEAVKKSDSEEVASAKAAANAVTAAEKQKQAAIAASERAEAGFQAQQTKRAQNRYYAMGPQMFEARAKEAWATDAAARAARPVRQLDISSPVLTRAAGFENGKNPFQAAADAFGGSTAAQNAEMRATTAALAEKEAAAAQDQAKAQREVNHAKLDQFDIQRRLTVAEGATKAELAQQVEWLRRIETYKRGGLTETQAQLRAEKEIADMQAVQAEAEAIRARAAPSRLSGIGRNALRFGEGAGLGRSFGSTATAAGVGFAITGAAALEGISSSVDFAKQIKDTADATGLTTRQVQVYSAAAKQAGVSTDQFRSGLGELNANLGKAKLGDEQTGKAFKALGINIKAAGSAGEVLPTIIDRLSKISDPAQRAAIETRLFGEEGRRLDALLSGGNQKINELADALIKTGAVLSSSDIQKLGETGQKLAQVKAQLQVDMAHVVAGNAEAIISLSGAIATLTGEVIQFLGSNPGAALAIIGALGGGAVGGFVGAAIGAVSGYAAGEHLNQLSADQNTDVKFRRAQLKAALDDYQSLKASAAGQVAPGDTDILIGNLHRSTSQAPNGGTLETLGEEVKRQAGLLNNAVAKARLARGQTDGDAFGKAVQKGQTDAAALAKLFAPKGPKGPSQEELERQALQRQKQYESQLQNFQNEILRINEQMTGDLAARAEIEDQLSQRQRNQQIENIELQLKENLTRKGVNKALEEKRAAALKGAAWDAEAARSAEIEEKLRVDTIQQRNAMAQVRSQTAADLADSNSGQDRTASDRRARALSDLDRQQEDERRNLQAQIDALKPGDATAKPLQERINALPQIYDNRRQDAMRQNAGPWAAYVDELPRTGKEIGESFEKAAVSGVQTLNDSLAQTAEKLTGLHGLAGQLLGDFIKIGLQAVEAQIFGGGGGGSGGGSGIGGLFSGIASLFGGGGSGGGLQFVNSGNRSDFGFDAGSFSLAGARAGGGPVGAGKTYLVGEKGPELLRMGGGSGTIVPNHQITTVNPNARAASGGQQNVVVVQPIHADFSGARTDEQTMKQFQDYADQKSDQAARTAIQVSGGQVPGIVKRQQTLRS